MSTGRRAAGARADAFVARALRHRLTIVAAAPGWGKSTLLRQMAEAVPSVLLNQPPAGWTPFALARGLIDGLTATRPEIASRFPPHAAPDSPDRAEQAPALAAEVAMVALAAVERPTFVLLDDLDAPDPVLRFLEALVLHAPADLHLVVASRRPPALRIARLRAAGAIDQISNTDLAVREDDVDALDLDAERATTVVDIIRATKGWPLAVRLAAEAMRRAGPLDPTGIVDRLLAPDAVLVEYLADDVLAQLSPPARELLALAAHVPHVSDSVLHELGRDDLAACFSSVVDLGIFLEPDPAARGQYRATLLGGEFLRRSQPAPPRDVLLRALDALLQHDDIENALVLAERLGDPAVARRVVLGIDRLDRLRVPEALEGVLRLAADNGPHAYPTELSGDLHYRRGEWDDALRCYAEASSLDEGSDARLARKRGVILYLRGRLDEADAVCAAARLNGDEPAEEAQLLAWRAAIRWMRGDPAGCAALLTPAHAAAERAGDDSALATVHTTRAMLAAFQGDRRANEMEYRQALHHATTANDTVQIVRIRTNLGSHHIEEGNYAEALEELEAAIGAAELIGSDTFTALAYCNRGDTYVRTGRLDLAVRDLRRAQQLWERLGSDLVDYALGHLGVAQLLRGQRADALALFNQAIELAERRGDRQSLAPALIGLARLQLDDDPVAAAAAADRALATNHAMWLPQAHAAAAWVALRRGDNDGARNHADEALDQARARADRPAVAEALLVRAATRKPVHAALAAEARQLWRDLGDPIGEARATMLLSEGATGAERDEMVATAQRLLYDAGALAHLADRQSVTAHPPETTTRVVITTLGGFRLSRGGAPVELSAWGSRKARDLVKLLVARRGAPVVRDEAADLLWPDERDRSARRLSVLLSTIRTVFDPAKEHPADHFVAADHDTVWLVREHLLIDVEAFLREAADGRRLLATGGTAKGEALLAQAVARYAGDFCADDPYASWADGIRELARHTFVDTSRQLASLATARNDHADAIRHQLRILDVDPYDEEAHLALIRALVAQRRHGEARRAYRTYCARLDELGLEAAAFPV